MSSAFSCAPQLQDSAVRPSAATLLALRSQVRSTRTDSSRVRAQALGNHPSPFRGRGMDFSEVRIYQSGDDVRSIDWKVTARRGRPHTKIFTEERDRPVLVAADLRASMHFATRGMFKSALASQIATLLGWHVSAWGDQLGGLVFNEEQVAISRLQRGEPGVLHLIRTLLDDRFWSPCEASPREGGVRALKRLVQQATPGSRVVLISDLRNLPREAVNCLHRIQRHSELLICHCFDPLEAELPPSGLYPVSSRGIRALLDTRGRATDMEYRQRFEQQVDFWRQTAHKSGMRYTQCSTPTAPLTYLERYGLGKMP